MHAAACAVCCTRSLPVLYHGGVKPSGACLPLRVVPRYWLLASAGRPLAGIGGNAIPQVEAVDAGDICTFVAAAPSAAIMPVYFAGSWPRHENIMITVALFLFANTKRHQILMVSYLQSVGNTTSRVCGHVVDGLAYPYAHARPWPTTKDRRSRSGSDVPMHPPCECARVA